MSGMRAIWRLTRPTLQPEAGIQSAPPGPGASGKGLEFGSPAPPRRPSDAGATSKSMLRPIKSLPTEMPRIAPFLDEMADPEDDPSMVNPCLGFLVTRKLSIFLYYRKYYWCTRVDIYERRAPLKFCQVSVGPVHQRGERRKCSTFSDAQIIGILKEQEAGAVTADLCRITGSARRHSTNGRPGLVRWRCGRPSGFAHWRSRRQS